MRGALAVQHVLPFRNEGPPGLPGRRGSFSDAICAEADAAGDSDVGIDTMKSNHAIKSVMDSVKSGPPSPVGHEP